MKIINLFFLAITILTISSSVSALDLQQARAQGLVREQSDGFVKATSTSLEAVQLANEVNAARKQEYIKISKQNGQPVDVVGKIAASEIAKKLGK